MNQRRQQGGNNQQPQQMQQNEVVSAEQKLRQVLESLRERGEELAGVLPKDIALDAFLANVNQALRNNPKLLQCTFVSIIDACVKAAYDGLRIDGKEAAIVDVKESYRVGTVWRDRMVARYMPMVFGLIKQILQAGAAITVKAVVVYQNEARTGRFVLMEGTTPGIQHRPFVEGEDRGPMIGAYAIAEVTRGVFKHEWMDKAAIEDVQNESKTDKVWKRWPTEMWKKTVIRRLRKSLSGTSAIRDMEAAMMFPQFDRSEPHPQLASPMTSRPTRALADHSGPESGVPLDLGREREGVVVDHDDREQQQQRDEPREQQQDREPEIQLPAGDAEWSIWGTEMEAKIADAKTVEDLDRDWAAAGPVFKHASPTIRNRLTALVTDRTADLALDAGAGAGAE